MQTIVGIDEAGYGPLVGPLVVGRAAFRIGSSEEEDATSRDASGMEPVDLWERLGPVFCRDLKGVKGGAVVVGDSKKVRTKAEPRRHLEMGCRAFGGVRCREHGGAVLGDGSQGASSLGVGEEGGGVSEGEVRVAAAMVGRACSAAGVRCLDLSCDVVYADRFNELIAATRSKAAASWLYVSQGLRWAWETHGSQNLRVAVDRQGGRTRYLDPLRLAFPEAAMKVIEEAPERSAYRLTHGDRAMTVAFEVGAEDRHFPVALASMAAKLSRERAMERFNAFFCEHLPDVAPTAGYGSDGKRWWKEVGPRLSSLGIDANRVRRRSGESGMRNEE